MMTVIICLVILAIIWELQLFQPILVIVGLGLVVTFFGWWSILVVIFAVIVMALWEHYASKIDKDLRGY